MTEPASEARPHLPGDALVDWPQRLARESPLLLQVLAQAPSTRVLDLGCGSGQHARFLAEQGCEVVAIDGSEGALERAELAPIVGDVQFLLGEIGAVERSVRGHFGAAFCLGNTVPYLLSPESVSRMLVGIKRRLLPGAPVLLHTLNYDRVFAGNARALPLEFVPDAQGELAVMRVIEPQEDGIVILTTTVLRYQPTSVPPLEFVDCRAEQLRGWTSEQLQVLLDVARFKVGEVYGDMQGANFDSRESLELVIVAS